MKRGAVVTAATHYGARIKQLRNERSWSQARLAELAGVSTRTIQRLEGGNDCGHHTLLAVAKAFGIDVSELTSSDEQQFADRPRMQLIPQIKHGNALLSVVAGAGLFARDNDPLKSEQELELMSAFIQDVHDTGELWQELDPKDHVEAEYRLTQSIAELEASGFLVFAARGRGAFRTALNPEPIPMSLATVLVLRHDNPAIVKLSSGIQAVAIPAMNEQPIGPG